LARTLAIPFALVASPKLGLRQYVYLWWWLFEETNEEQEYAGSIWGNIGSNVVTFIIVYSL